MAYKFQLGPARLSGSVTHEGAITAESSQISASTIALANASGIAGNGLASASSDNGKLELLFKGGFESGLQADSQGVSIKLSGTANGLDLIAGEGLALKVSASSGLELTDNGIKISDGGISNGLLVNESITLNAGAGLASIGTIALGATASVAVDGTLEDLDALTEVVAGQFIVGTGAGVFGYESGSTARDSLGLGTSDNVTFANVTGVTGSFTGDLTVTGDLVVNGTTTTVNTDNLVVSDKNILIASGSTPENAVGAGLTVDGANVEWKYSDNGIGSAIGSGDIWIASGSAGLVDIQAANFYGDGSNLNGVVADKATGMTMRSYVTGSGTAQSLGGNAGFYVCSDFDENGESSAAVQLHLSGGVDGWDNGDIVVVKAYANAGTAGRNLTIYPSGTEMIVDADAGFLTLESDMAAVSLIYNSGMWFVY